MNTTRFAKIRIAAALATFAAVTAAGTGAASAQPNNSSDTRWSPAQVKQLCDIAGGRYFPGSWHYGCIFPDGTILDCRVSDQQCTSFRKAPKPKITAAVATVATAR